MSETFYAVAYGTQRGVYVTYKEAQAAMKGFPSPVYKKFDNREKADEFLKKSQPESKQIDVDENDDKFYAVARGRVIGIFKDLETVKKNTTGFPKAMHKKFNTFAEAKAYLEKYAEGKVEEKPVTTPKKKRSHAETLTSGDEEDNALQETKPVARKRTAGKIGETDESEGEHLDQTQSADEMMGESQSQQQQEGRSDELGAISAEDATKKAENSVTENGEQQEEKEGEEKEKDKDTEQKKEEVPEKSKDEECSEAKQGNDTVVEEQ